METGGRGRGNPKGKKSQESGRSSSWVTESGSNPNPQAGGHGSAGQLDLDFPELSLGPSPPTNPWGKPRAWGRNSQAQQPQVAKLAAPPDQEQPQFTGDQIQQPRQATSKRAFPAGADLPQVEVTATQPSSLGNQDSQPKLDSQTGPLHQLAGPTHSGGNWLSLPDDKDEITLPLRVGVAKEFSKNKITVAMNHFPLTIKLPEIFMYHVEVQRIRREEPKSNSPPKGKKKAQRPPDCDDAKTEATKLPKRVLQKILKCARVYLTREFEVKSKQMIGIATDFVSNVFTTKRLETIGLIHTLDMSKLDKMRIDDPDPVEDEKGTFTITLTPTDWEIDVLGLAAHVNNSEGFRDPQLTVELPAVYNAVIKAMPNYKYLAMGRSLLIRFPPEGQDGHRLGGGLSSWAGISACVNPGWRFFLNIELAYSTMRVGDYVIPALKDFFGSDSTNVTQWSEDDIEKGSNFLKSAKVQYSPKPGIIRGGTVLRIHRQPPSQATFKKDGIDVTVEKYYKDQYNLKLNYPDGPLLIFSGKENKVPAELCKIKSGQSVNRKLSDQQTRNMVTIARKNPNILEDEILKATRELNLNRNELFAKFGVRMDDRMLEIQCRVIDPPVISYGRPGTTGVSEVNPDKGAWLVWNQNFCFKRPAVEATYRQWGIFIFGRAEQNSIAAFTDAMVQVGKKCGLYFSNTPHVQFKLMNDKLTGNNVRDREQHNQNVKTLAQIFTKFQRDGCQLVIVVLPYKPSRFYGQAKQASELLEHGVGILTQCIVNQNFNPRPPKAMNAQSSTIQQMLLKINSKLDGISHSVSLPLSLRGRYARIDFPNLQEAVLVIGADVTHPPPGTGMKDPNDPKKEIPVPSFASVTGSIDRTCMPFMMHVQAQKRMGKGAAEVIPNLGDIVAGFITEFFRRNKILPGKIIYYRDGVGDGQFKEVLHVEMRGIRSACYQFDKLNRGVPYMPKITFITVQKRHKTRLFMHSKTSRRTENAPPGTIVDAQIVHPTEIDFYLLSHQAIQGTSRPTRYHVLWDDSKFDQDEIQIMTYYMCYMYVRCNRSVKIPAPTYYAHWAAARAKTLAEGNEHLYSDNLSPLNEKLQRMGNFKLNFPMHFI